MISIIIPLKNAEKYIASAIDSALSLTGVDVEVIVVDDASTDSSASIACEYAQKDDRVKLYSLPGVGPGPARQFGFSKSKGHLIAFLDADDRLHPYFAEILIKLLKDYDVDIACAPMARVKSFSHLPSYKNISLSSPLIISGEEAVENGLYQKQIDNSTCAKIYKRHILENLSFPAGRYEDLALFPLLFLRADKIAHIPLPLYFYTINPTSFISRFSPQRLDALDVTENIVADMAASHPYLLKAAKDRALSAAFNIFNLVVSSDASQHEVINRCKNIIKKYRMTSLFNKKVRIKNKIGIIVTLIGGFKLLKCIARRSAT